jgi:hypothetical protein
MEHPNGGMSGGAVHQAGSQGATVPDLMHPRSTIYMGQDEGGILPLVFFFFLINILLRDRN